MYKIPEARIRVAEGSALYSTTPITVDDDAVKLLKEEMRGCDRECVYVLNLDNRHYPISYSLVAVGGLRTANVTVANIFKSAILQNAACVILLHNHTSYGPPAPSGCDIEITQKVKAAGELLDIPLLDHIIVGSSGETYSFRGHKLL